MLISKRWRNPFNVLLSHDYAFYKGDQDYRDFSFKMKIIQDVRYLFRKSVERSDISPGKPGPSRLSNYGGFFQTRRVALSESQNCSTVDHDVNSLLKILACFLEFIFDLALLYGKLCTSGNMLAINNVKSFLASSC